MVLKKQQNNYKYHSRSNPKVYTEMKIPDMQEPNYPLDAKLNIAKEKKTAMDLASQHTSCRRLHSTHQQES